jgi:hypothetical protein
MTACPKPIPRGPRPRKRIRTRRPPGTKRREAKAAGSIDPDSWQEVLRFYGGRCARCGVPWQQQGHCKALAKGGRHEIGNLVPLCARDNARQGQAEWWPERRHPFMREA